MEFFLIFFWFCTELIHAGWKRFIIQFFFSIASTADRLEFKTSTTNANDYHRMLSSRCHLFSLEKLAKHTISAMEFSFSRRLFRPRSCCTASAHWSRSSENIDFLIITDNDSSAMTCVENGLSENWMSINHVNYGQLDPATYYLRKISPWIESKPLLSVEEIRWALANPRTIVACAVDTQNRHFNSITLLRSCDKYFKISILIISTHNHHVGARTFTFGLLSVCRNSKCLCKLINFHFDSIHFLAYVILWYCVH